MLNGNQDHLVTLIGRHKAVWNERNCIQQQIDAILLPGKINDTGSDYRKHMDRMRDLGEELLDIDRQIAAIQAALDQ